MTWQSNHTASLTGLVLEEEEEERDLINDLKRYGRLAVAWNRHGSPVPRWTLLKVQGCAAPVTQPARGDAARASCRCKKKWHALKFSTTSHPTKATTSPHYLRLNKSTKQLFCFLGEQHKILLRTTCTTVM